MGRFAVLLLLANCVYAAQSTVDIDTAAKIYQAAAVREQVRASLGTMPEHMRQLFSRDVAAQLTEQQLAAITAAAQRGFRIDVFEAPALQALADNLDPVTVAKAQAFLASDLGKRMVAADVAEALLGEEVSDKILSGELAAPSTPKRDLHHREIGACHPLHRIAGADLSRHGRGRSHRHGHRLRPGPEGRRRAGAKDRRSQPRGIGGEHAGADAQDYWPTGTGA